MKYLNEIINIWLTLARDLLLIKENKSNFIVHNQLIKILSQIAVNNSRKSLVMNLLGLLKIKDSLSRNINPQLTLENYFLNIKSYA